MPMESDNLKLTLYKWDLTSYAHVYYSMGDHCFQADCLGPWSPTSYRYFSRNYGVF